MMSGQHSRNIPVLVRAPMMSCIRAAACGVALIFSMSAAQARTRQDEQLWINLTAMGSIKDDLIYFAEVQPRLRDGMSRTDQVILRGALGWKLTPKLSVYQGYGYIVLPVAGAPDTGEHRGFQQVSWTIGSIAGGGLSSRTRLEQRWRRGDGNAGWRLREMLRYVHPFNEEGKGSKALVYAEGFVALNGTNWGARAGFDQIRTFLGFEIPVGAKSTIEAGYLNHYVNTAGPNNRMNHVASLTLFFRH